MRGFGACVLAATAGAVSSTPCGSVVEPAPLAVGHHQRLLVDFESFWRVDLSGKTVPDGDEWWVVADGIGWLHQLFFSEENPTADRWKFHKLPLQRDSAGDQTTIYARRQVRVAFRDFRHVEFTMRIDPAVGAIVYVNGARVYQHNMKLPQYLDVHTTSASRCGDSIVKFSVDGRYFGDRGVSIVAVELHGPASSTSADRVPPGTSFDLRLVGYGELWSDDGVARYSLVNNVGEQVYSDARGRRAAGEGGGDLPIDFGSQWRYLDDGSDQGTAWQAPAFDDASWSEGPTEIGFGDGDEATVVSSSPATFYFRKAFTLAAPVPLLADLIFDDGAIVYVNGVEVFRDNLYYDRTVRYDDYATSTSSDNEEANIEIEADLLQAGVNVLAVEVHNRDPTSSDVSFDFALIPAPHSIGLLNEGAGWRYFDSVGSTVPSGWQQPAALFDDSSWPRGVAPLGYDSDNLRTELDFGDDEDNKPITTYYRRTIPNYRLVDAGGSSLRGCSSGFFGKLNADDGAVVYVNGVEVTRYNMPTGTIGDSTTAASTIGSSTTPHTFTVPVGAIPDGDVTIAASVHQRRTTSSDIFFELSLLPVVCNCTSSLEYTVVRPPYLQQLTDSQVILRWDTDFAATSTVAYGLSSTALTQSTSAPCTLTSTRKHAVRITGLQPETTYHYTLVGDASGTLYSFTTEPRPEDVHNFLLWFLGDAGTANSYQEGVRDAFSAAYPGGPDLMLLGGDNAYNDGTEMEYEAAVFQMYPTFLNRLSVWSTLGNHDSRSANSDTLTGVHFDSFDFPRNAEKTRSGAGVASGSEAYYSIDHGLAHIVCLDSEDTDTDPTAPMATWLVADLAAARAAGQQWLLAFWHHPPYSKGSHDSDTEHSLIAMREVFLPILEGAGVDLVMTGHSHVYERSKLIDGHYGVSSTFNSGTHVTQSGGGGPGDPYIKPPGLVPHSGAVYIVAGSAGALSSGSSASWNFLSHPAMEVNLGVRGSLVVQFSETATERTLDGKFLLDTGAEGDHFVIQKYRDDVAEERRAACRRGVRPEAGHCSA